jgi:hypothetical protein
MRPRQDYHLAAIGLIAFTEVEHPRRGMAAPPFVHAPCCGDRQRR